ncbi:hypothetical protein BST20_06610 [Mycobacterium branderi]|nr:discoidin domain-containing protein [Mycobacterium branderi]ORA40447.1 hypothetical protein BST20_06610 [Mycobacterium branderi]
MLFGPEPSAAPPTRAVTKSDDADFTHRAAETAADGEYRATGAEGDEASAPRDDGDEPVELDRPDSASPQPRTDQPDDVNAGAKKTAWILGAAVAAAAMAITAGLVTFSDHPASPPPLPSVAPPAPAVPASTGTTAPTRDQAIPFTASAPGCPTAGSTPAQALTDTTTDSAWVCVRGIPGAEVDGQVLYIDFGKTYKVSAISVTPGWIAKTPGGKDEWLAHRVVSRLQYNFNDDDHTIFVQDTGNVHGPVTNPLNRPILASRVTVIVRQTSRPPAGPATSSSPVPAEQPGFVDSVLGAGAAPAPADSTTTTGPAAPAEQPGDPVDYTFAVSAMKFLGYQP